MLLNTSEKHYRKVIGSIGVAMLFFQLFINIFSVSVSVLSMLLSYFFPLDSPAFQVVYQLIYAAGYTLSFMLPVAILKRLLEKSPYPYLPMQTSLRMTPWIFLILPAGIALNFSAAYLNALMGEFIHYSDFLSEMMAGEMTAAPLTYEWVLQFIVVCVVPGFCEEFLFRGAIQTNCRPFGRINAIMISSILFAFMHQNAGQIFYTFTLGIFLGIVYEKTQSIWPTTALHIFNNFLSTIESSMLYRIKDLFGASLAINLFEVGIFVIGFVSLMILIFVFSSEKNHFRDGIFGRSVPASDTYASSPISAKRAFRLFLTPTMVIFLCISLMQILLLLGLAALFYVVPGM